MDGLVAAPEGLLAQGRRRVGATCVVALFLAVTGGAGVLDALAPARGPALTKHERKIREREYAKSSVWDGSLATYVDRERQESSNVRRALVPWYIAFVLLPLREGGSGVVVGSEGWLYLADRIVPGRTGHRSDHGPVAANVLAGFDRRLASIGVRTQFLPLPRKATIATRFLPPGVDAHPEYEQELLTALAQRRIPHVDLYEVWDGVDQVDLWKRQDTHWSTLAKWLALQAGARALDAWVPPKERATTLRPNRVRPVVRMLLTTLGIPLDHRVMSYLPKDELPTPQVVRQTMKNLPVGEPKVVLIGTSFSATAEATRLLSHVMNSPVSNLARGGQNAGRTLSDAVSTGKLPPGVPLILEIPSFQLQWMQPGTDGTMVLDRNLLSPLVEVEPPAWSVLPLAVESKGRQRVGVGLHELATSGDGIVLVELSGRPVGAARLQVTARMGEYKLSLPWPAGVDTLRLPVLTDGIGAPAIRVDLEGAPDDHSALARLITELDLEGSVVLAETAVVETSGTWHQERPLPASILDSRHAAVWISLDPGVPAGLLTIELIGAIRGTTHHIARIPLRPGGSALLSTSAPVAPWTGIRLSGSGAAPARIGSVRIADLPRH